MKTRKATAQWQGSLKEGKGSLKTETGILDAPYNFRSRFQEGSQTNPEELIGAAHAGCFSMAFSLELSEAGHVPDEINTTAEVTFDEVEGDFEITKIVLNTSAKVPGIDKDKFHKIAQAAKGGCPVSKALKNVDIELNAELVA